VQQDQFNCSVNNGQNVPLTLRQEEQTTACAIGGKSVSKTDRGVL